MKDYYDKVKALLQARPETRDDDMKLYSLIVYQVTGMRPNVGFYEATFHHDKYNLPSYESVTRARRKVQEQEPTLRGKKHGRRQELEQEYHDYYSPNKQGGHTC